MAESTNSDVKQRVEALEHLSHHRVIERVGEVEQRMSRVEGIRDTDERHTATKADVTRLEKLIVETSSTQLVEIADARQESRDLHAKAMLEIAKARQESRDLNAATHEEMQKLNAATREEIQKLNAQSRELNSETRQEARDLNADSRLETQELIAASRQATQEQIAANRLETQELIAKTRQEARDLHAKALQDIAESRRLATAQNTNLRKYIDEQLRKQLKWIIGIMITLLSLAIAVLTFIIKFLP